MPEDCIHVSDSGEVIPCDARWFVVELIGRWDEDQRTAAYLNVHSAKEAKTVAQAENMDYVAVSAVELQT